MEFEKKKKRCRLQFANVHPGILLLTFRKYMLHIQGSKFTWGGGKP